MGKKWTEDEVDFLRDKWGETSIKRIAKRLGRSVNAIKMKAAREGLSNPLDHLDGITLNQLANIFQVSYGWTMKKIWIDQLDLPYKTKVTAQTKAYRYICIDDFWKWAEKNKHKINFANLEENIMGKEPDWLKEKRRADKANLTYKKINIPWSDEEENILKSMLRQHKYTYYEISQRIGRTEGAVKKRIEDNGWKERPVRTDGYKWTDEEVCTLIDMKNKGYGNNTIAKSVNKTARAVEGKLDRLVRDEMYRHRLKSHLIGGKDK